MALMLLACFSGAQAEAMHVIICGSGGEPAYTEKFGDWGNRLRTVLQAYSGDDPSRVILLTEAPASGDARPSTLQGIRGVFQELGQSLSAQDELYVYLIGHGSHRAGVSKFNIPGPDLTAEDLDALLDALPVQRCGIINGSSTSAGFVNVLSAPGRIVCTATKSVEERNVTQFMGHLVDALEDDTADMDRDGRVSLYEACTQAAVLTSASYANEGLIASEHAILDDNGDGLGTRLPPEGESDAPKQLDGEAARASFLKDYRFPPEVSQDLVTAYQDALESIDELKEKKGSLPEDAYYAQLESLLLQAAQANRAIRGATDE